MSSSLGVHSISANNLDHSGAPYEPIKQHVQKDWRLQSAESHPPHKLCTLPTKTQHISMSVRSRYDLEANLSDNVGMSAKELICAIVIRIT
eukprot:4473266-Amphidinium_carterae.1